MREPVLQEIGSLIVLRDDLYPGGTKARALGEFLKGAEEFVYASPAYGYAQVALAYCCREVGAQATIFTAKRSRLHPRTQEALLAGAKVVQIPYGYLTHVQAQASAYAQASGAVYLPFGFDTPPFVAALARLASSLPIVPAEVWTVAGSGTLSRALQIAWPQARFFAIQIGHAPTVGKAKLLLAPERFEENARVLPPFPSCLNYDAKAWQFLRTLASPGALFWNVAA